MARIALVPDSCMPPLREDGMTRSCHWYSTQPTVTKLAEDRSEQLRRNPDVVWAEIEKRVRADARNRGDFERQPAVFPHSGADVIDELEARLVILRPEQSYSKDPGNKAEQAAKAIFESRGNAPRIYRNALVFLAPDQTRLQDLEDAVRKFLAWESIRRESDSLNLTPQQARQAETQRGSTDQIRRFSPRGQT